jgi:hypothetical protein
MWLSTASWADVNNDQDSRLCGLTLKPRKCCSKEVATCEDALVCLDRWPILELDCNIAKVLGRPKPAPNVSESKYEESTWSSPS